MSFFSTFNVFSWDEFVASAREKKTANLRLLSFDCWFGGSVCTIYLKNSDIIWKNYCCRYHNPKNNNIICKYHCLVDWGSSILILPNCIKIKFAVFTFSLSVLINFSFHPKGLVHMCVIFGHFDLLKFSLRNLQIHILLHWFHYNHILNESSQLPFNRSYEKNIFL